jgi:hypothetical protein
MNKNEREKIYGRQARKNTVLLEGHSFTWFSNLDAPIPASRDMGASCQAS